MTAFPSDMTLAEARTVLRELVDDGHECPVCTQYAKVYRRKIHATMAKTLIAMYRHGGAAFVHTHEASQLSWWDLIEEERVRRPDGGRAGWWRLTRRGVEWVLGLSTVQKYARIYDGRVLGLVGPPVTIRDALGDKFRYDDLMEGI